jgi:hypothetical protein
VAVTNAEVPPDTTSTRPFYNTAGLVVPPVEMGVFLRLLVPLAQTTPEESFNEATAFVQSFAAEVRHPQFPPARDSAS